MIEPQIQIFLNDLQKKKSFSFDKENDQSEFVKTVTNVAEFISLHAKQCKLSYTINEKGLAMFSIICPDAF